MTSSLFASFENIDFSGSFILPFFTRKVSIVIFSEGGTVTRSSDRKMIKLLTFGILFSPPRDSRENSKKNDDGYHVFPSKYGL